MEDTTLITFMMQHPTARKVELLGSWDNFNIPYAMELDSRRGRGYWSGCHTYRDIVCDGETMLQTKRDGGLLMGGTYWYFYRIDDDEEYCDSTQLSTTSCPLMPGQKMNLLEVPFDNDLSTVHSRASSLSLAAAAKTLNPLDRYNNPQPPAKPILPNACSPDQATSPTGYLPTPPASSKSKPRHTRSKSANDARSHGPYSSSQARSHLHRTARSASFSRSFTNANESSQISRCPDAQETAVLQQACGLNDKSSSRSHVDQTSILPQRDSRGPEPERSRFDVERQTRRLTSLEDDRDITDNDKPSPSNGESSAETNPAIHINILRVKHQEDSHDLLEKFPCHLDPASLTYLHPGPTAHYIPSPLRVLATIEAQDNEDQALDTSIVQEVTYQGCASTSRRCSPARSSFALQYSALLTNLDPISGDTNYGIDWQPYESHDSLDVDAYLLDRFWSDSPELGLDDVLPDPAAASIYAERSEISGSHMDAQHTIMHDQNNDSSQICWPASPSFSSIHGDTSDAVLTPMHRFSDSHWTPHLVSDFSSFDFQLDDNDDQLIRDTHPHVYDDMAEHPDEKLSLHTTHSSIGDQPRRVLTLPMDRATQQYSENHGARFSQGSDPHTDDNAIDHTRNVSKTTSHGLTTMEDLINDFEYLGTAVI